MSSFMNIQKGKIWKISINAFMDEDTKINIVEKKGRII